MSVNDWQVVVIDDEPDSLELVQGILEHHGIYSIGCMSAEAALDVCADVIPTLFVIDLALPQMDGWGLLEALQSEVALQAVPRVAITAYHTPQLANEAIDAGFDAYFPKPIDATAFVRELVSIVQAT